MTKTESYPDDAAEAESVAEAIAEDTGTLPLAGIVVVNVLLFKASPSFDHLAATNIGGTADRPLPIRDQEADVILLRVQDGVAKPKPKVLFEPGEMVRVTDGPFNDFNGVVEEVNYEKSRLRVAVLIFGRSTPVELEFGQVEKA